MATIPQTAGEDRYDAYIPGLDDPADAPPYVETLESRLLSLGFTEQQIAKALGEPDAYAKRHSGRRRRS